MAHQEAQREVPNLRDEPVNDSSRSCQAGDGLHIHSAPQDNSHLDHQRASEDAHRYINMEPLDRRQESLPSRTLEDLDEEEEEDREENEVEGEDLVNSARDAGHLKPDFAQHCEHVHLDHADEHQDCTDMDQSQQLDLLRDLLRIERANTENSRANTAAIKKYLQQLQLDYLKQQSDLVEALELGHKIKAQKEAQVATIEETVREKDALIEQLKLNIANLDESKLRQEFESNLSKQKQLNQLELEQLRHQINSLEQQLVKEKANQAQISQEYQDKSNDQQKLHDKELAALCSRLKQTQEELDRLLSEPQNLIIKALKEDKSTLDCRLDEQHIITQELQTKYDNLKRRLECLMAEQEQSDHRNREEVDKLQQLHADQRSSLTELKCELEDKEEIIQILQFNLQRSEKRVKNLLGVMKNKEETFRAMVAQMELKHLQEVEKIRHEYQSAEKQLIANGGDLDRKQNELVKLRLEHENQLESMRNDRDERLAKVALEKQNLERELRATELKLAREIEQASGKTRLIDQLHKEVKQFRDESKRLSIELTKCEAKLYAKQQELNQSIEKLNIRRSESQAELFDAAKMQQVTVELDEEKRMSRKLSANIEELKKENGKLNVKLRIAESNLDRMTLAINREHSKMMREYEKKLEQIRSEQVNFDKSKMRYKRYGYKLKKYCEHLRRVHEHLCNPAVCGYILGPLRAPAATSMSPSAKMFERNSLDHCDKVSLLSNENECPDQEASHLTDQLDRVSDNSNRYSTDDGYSTRKSNQHKPSPAPAERFIVKRTGLSPVLKRTPSHRARKLSFKQTTANSCSKIPLKPRDPNIPRNDCYSSQVMNEHEYCYINEDLQSHRLEDKLTEQADEPTCRRAVI